jgi:hypothetical protein
MTTPKYVPPTYYPPTPNPTPISPLVGGLGDMPMPTYVPPTTPAPVQNSANRLIPYTLPDGTTIAIPAGSFGSGVPTTTAPVDNSASNLIPYTLSDGTTIQIPAGSFGTEPPPTTQPYYPNTPNPPTPTVAQPTPAYSNDQIQQFINANMQDPYAIAQAAMQNNISVNDIANAMNVDPSVVTGYFNNAQIGTPDQTGSNWAMPTYAPSTPPSTSSANPYPMPAQVDPNSNNADGYPPSMPYGYTPNSPTPTQAPQVDPSGSALTPLDQYLSSLSNPDSTSASQ